MELTANEAEAYLVGGQLKKKKYIKGKACLYKIQGQTHQLHIHLRQYKTSVQYRTTKRTLNIDKTLYISIILKLNQLN